MLFSKPDFFIVGAPRCGTTALSEYLREHPNIYFSQPKEPHYFAEDLPHHRLVKNWDEYLRLFRKATPDHLAIGEGSVFYLYSSVAIKKIYDFDPNARIIVMLRNPVELISSLYTEMLYIQVEDEEFARAWALQGARRAGECIPKTCHTPAFLQYESIGRLGGQVERLLQTFPRNQVKMILFEDFTAATRETYDEVLSFLRLPSDGRTDFPRINQPKSHKLKWLADLTQRPPAPLRRLAVKVKHWAGLEQFGFLDKIRQLNAKKYNRQAPSPDLRAAMGQVFQDDIEKLSGIVGRDLSHWGKI